MLRLIVKLKSSGLTKNTFLLALTSLFGDIATEMLYPILPIFLTQYLGAGGSIVGLVEGIATATQNIEMGFAGWLSDKLHTRKPLAIIGYVLAAISKPLIGLSTAWTGVFAARFMDRLGAGTRSAPRDALIADSVDKENRGKAFGLEGIGDNLGAFLGPIIAIVLLYTLKIEIRQIFYLAIIPGLLAVVMIILVKEKKDGTNSKVKLDTNFFHFPKKYWNYIAVTAIFGIGNVSSSFMILQTKGIGVPLITTILIYAIYNLVAAIVSYPSGSLSDRFGRKKVLFVSFLTFLVAVIGFAVTRNFVAIAILFAIYGAFQGIFRSVGKAFASDLIPKEIRASGVGWYNATVGLSGLVASLSAGLIWDKISHPAVFIFAAIFAILGSFSLLLLRQD